MTSVLLKKGVSPRSDITNADGSSGTDQTPTLILQSPTTAVIQNDEPAMLWHINLQFLATLTRNPLAMFPQEAGDQFVCSLLLL